MSFKSHCDVCDSTDRATSSAVEQTQIDGPNNLRHDVRVSVTFGVRYGAEEPKDLCNGVMITVPAEDVRMK